MEGMATKVETDSEPSIFTESEVVDEPDSESEVKDPIIGTYVDLPTEPEPAVVDEAELELEVVAELESEVEELLVGTLADLLEELVVELVSSTPAMRDDPLHILLEATIS